MSLKNVRLEVMKHLEKDVDSLIEKYLIPIENIWQPSDFLPDSEITGLIMGSPVDKCDLDAENKFVAQSITNKRRTAYRSKSTLLFYF